jgi:phosphoglycolate phosphatase
VTRDVLLFDLDGTLTDPRAGIVGSLRFALSQLAIPCPTDDVLVSYIGPPLRGTFATLLGTNESDRIEEAMQLYRQRFADTGLYENRVYDGVPEMLARAGSAATAVYVATSKPAIYAERIVRHFGLAQHFRKVYGPELDGRYEDKADLLAHLLRQENVEPEAAVMIGDREADVRAAKASGVRSIGVLWGYGSVQELIDAGTDALCGTPGELADCLARRTVTSDG